MLVLFVPVLLYTALSTDSTIYYVLFATSSLLLITWGLRAPRFLFLAGVAIGLAHLTRQDGVLLLGALVLSVGLAAMPLVGKVRGWALGLGGYLLVLLPWAVRNGLVFGTLAPVSTWRLALLTSGEDLYAYGEQVALAPYLDQGVGAIMAAKLPVLRANMELVLPLVAVFATLVFWRQRLRGEPDRRDFYGPPLLWLGLLFLVYTFGMTFIGEQALARSVWAFLPFVVVLLAEVGHGYVRPRWLVGVLVGVLVGLFGWQGITQVRGLLREEAQQRRQMTALHTVLEADESLGREIVVMTRHPWQLTYATGYRTIQIPNNDLPTILAVADQYGATHLLLTRHAARVRSALGGVYAGTEQDGRLELVARLGGGWQVYRIVPMSDTLLRKNSDIW